MTGYCHLCVVLRFPSAVRVKVCTFCTLCDLWLLFSEGVKCLLCRMFPELVLLFIFSGVRIHCCYSEHTSYWMAYVTHNKITCPIYVFGTEIKITYVIDHFSGVSMLTRGGHVILGTFAKLRKETISFAMLCSPRTSTWTDTAPTERIFHEIWYYEYFFEKLS